MNCIFCNKIKPIFENENAIAFFDEFPVSEGHMLIITKEHKETLFDTTYEEKESMFDLLSKCKEYIDNKYKPTGYNIGFNCGVSAGQSIMHVHMHIIPRYDNDIENP